MIPKKLKEGDEVRIISPSRSMSMISKESQEIANKRFKDLGLKVSFSENSSESDEFVSSSIDSRIKDLHVAFLDKNVKAIQLLLAALIQTNYLSILILIL